MTSECQRTCASCERDCACTKDAGRSDESCAHDYSSSVFEDEEEKGNEWGESGDV